MLYDTIGTGYRQQRVPDARIQRAIHAALGDTGSIVNVGAGTGSYEPQGRCVAAIEPSVTMIKQRHPTSAPAIQALASRLPLRDVCVDIAMAVLTVHHWSERALGFGEMGRVARRRLVFLTWDPEAPGFWLTDDYFPEILLRDRRSFPRLSEFRRALGRLGSAPVPIPHDCTDGFTGAFWRRPHAYLNPIVRAGMSTFSKIENADAGLVRLREELRSGAWARKYGHLMGSKSLDIGYRLISVDL